MAFNTKNSVAVQVVCMVIAIVILIICQYLTIASYDEINVKYGLAIEYHGQYYSYQCANGNQECVSWMINLIFGWIERVFSFLTFLLIVRRGFIQKPDEVAKDKVSRMIIFVFSSIAAIAPIAGIITLVSCKNVFTLNILTLFLMFLTGALILLSGVVLERQLQQKREEEPLLYK